VTNTQLELDDYNSPSDYDTEPIVPVANSYPTIGKGYVPRWQYVDMRTSRNRWRIFGVVVAITGGVAWALMTLILVIG
jgi:hypothetical protein